MVGGVPSGIITVVVSHCLACRSQMVADNGGQHIGHVLPISVDYLYVLNKAMIRHQGVVFETRCFFLSIKFPSFHSAITQCSCNSAV
ncbi:hypothetical protein TNCV_4734851 [Trichonephila clavipes]|nr:hypothetical protein TNCV_4734851 [Trichonephila clavipes]